MDLSRAFKHLMVVALASCAMAACYARVDPAHEECRNTLRRRGDVEVCRTRCGDEGCRTHCVEQERWAREHHCWLE